MLFCSYTLFEDFGTLTPILQDLSDVSKTLLIFASIVYNILTRDGQNLLHFVRHIGRGITVRTKGAGSSALVPYLRRRIPLGSASECINSTNAHALFLGSICFTTACDCRIRGHVRLRREGSVPHIAA
jgi:hypothetical protein